MCRLPFKPSVRALRSWLAVCLCGGGLLSANVALPDVAHASCVWPAPDVIWSYPAQDEIDVPLDADLLLVTEGMRADEPIMLDGEPLTAASDVPGHYDLGLLQPNTTYTVAIAAMDQSAGRTVEHSWQFTTGDARGMDERPDAVTILSASSRQLESFDDVPCPRALYANTCFDTGVPVLEAFETDIDAELWAVESVRPDGGDSSWTLYPGECGQPRALDYRFPGAGIRYRVHAILRNGGHASSDSIAAPLELDDDASPSDQRDAGAEMPSNQVRGDAGRRTSTGDDAEASSACAVTDAGRGGAHRVAWLVLGALYALGARRRDRRRWQLPGRSAD